MNTLTVTTEKTPQHKAQGVHEHILFNLQLAKGAALEVYHGLKEMRDGKLYVELGFDTFEEYTEGALNIKRRQAYNYIQVYESLPKEFLQSHAELGVTKLQLLTSVPVMELDEFSEKHDLEELSTRELEELTQQLTAKENQISLLETETSMLTAKVDELESRPVEVAVQEPDQKAIEKMERELRKKLKKEEKAAVSTLESEIAALKETMEKQEDSHKKAMDSIVSQAQASNERAATLEKRIALAGNDYNEIFKIHFDFFQDAYRKLIDMIESAPEKDEERFKKATSQAMSQLVQELEGQLEI